MERQQILKQDNYLQMQAETAVQNLRLWEIGVLALTEQQIAQGKQVIQQMGAAVVAEAEHSVPRASERELIAV